MTTTPRTDRLQQLTVYNCDLARVQEAIAHEGNVIIGTGDADCPRTGEPMTVILYA